MRSRNGNIYRRRDDESAGQSGSLVPVGPEASFRSVRKPRSGQSGSPVPVGPEVSFRPVRGWWGDQTPPGVPPPSSVPTVSVTG